MKDYNEMVESLFERREKYQEERRKRMRRIGRMASVVSCCCLVLLAGIGVFKGDLLSRDPAELLKGGSDDCSQSSGFESEISQAQDERNEPDVGDNLQESAGVKDSENSIFFSGSSLYLGDTDGEGRSESADSSREYDRSNSSRIDSGGSESATAGNDSDKSDFTPAELPEHSDASVAPGDSDGSFQTVGGGASSAVGGSGAPPPECYGGTYTDHDGHRVILITQDSAENRAEICGYLGISDDDTVFQSAAYSLSYLMEVQNKISRAMSRNELPFVVESALMEDGNRVKVTVTIMDQTKIAELQAFDSAGGAIEIVFAVNRSASQE